MEEQNKMQKPSTVEFIPASSLPKGTSLRKKFNPPFKKSDKEENQKEK